MEGIHARKGEFKNAVEDFSLWYFFNVFLDIASLTQER